jgi:Ca2+/Na+ antiporter
MNTLATLLADGGLYISTGVLLLVLIVVVLFFFLRR